MKIVATPEAPRIRVTRPFRFTDLSGQLKKRIVAGGSSSEFTDRDARMLRTADTTVVTDYQLLVSTFGGSREVIMFGSSNESVATVDATGNVSFVSPGSATLTAYGAGKSISVDLEFEATEEGYTDSLIAFVEGSLAHHAANAVDSRLAGKSASTSLRIFTTQNHSGQSYVRNPNVWCADIDLSCISPWNSTGGATRAGTLISPRHLLFATHYQISVGATVRFVMMDGTVVNRTLSGKVELPHSNYAPDITIGVLNEDVPEGIGFSKVLPDDWTDRLPALDYTRPIPVLGLDQEEKALVQYWFYHHSLISGYAAPESGLRLGFHEYKISGDSGNPVFLIANGELVLLTMWTYGGHGVGTPLVTFNTQVNAAMTALGGGYQLTFADLSGFINFEGGE